MTTVFPCFLFQESTGLVCIPWVPVLKTIRRRTAYSGMEGAIMATVVSICSMALTRSEPSIRCSRKSLHHRSKGDNHSAETYPPLRPPPPSTLNCRIMCYFVLADMGTAIFRRSKYGVLSRPMRRKIIDVAAHTYPSSENKNPRRKSLNALISVEAPSISSFLISFSHHPRSQPFPACRHEYNRRLIFPHQAKTSC